MLPSSLLPTILLAAAVTVHGHGGLVSPTVTWNNPNSDTSQFCGTLDGPSILPGSAYNTSPGENTNAFTRNMKASAFKTIRDLIKAKDTSCGACGITNPNGTPQQLPADGTIHWAHGAEGFLNSHEGPCEVWCDETRVFHDDNCAKNVPTGVMQLDAAKCQGAKLLTVYWLALHTPQWQIYLNCVPLTNGGPVPPTPSQSSSVPSMNPTQEPSQSPYTSSYAPTTQPTEAPSPDPYSPSDAPSHSHSEYPNTPSNSPSPPTPSSSSYASPPPPTSGSNGQLQPWQKCGGNQYKGPTQCPNGYHCKNVADSYSQCVPEDSKGESGLSTWAQYGGSTYSGPTKCKSSDVCKVLNDYYSQCVPK
ncbi:unnamed protein product [Aphanomyces euteiches]